MSHLRLTLRPNTTKTTQNRPKFECVDKITTHSSLMVIARGDGLRYDREKGAK